MLVGMGLLGGWEAIEWSFCDLSPTLHRVRPQLHTSCISSTAKLTESPFDHVHLSPRRRLQRSSDTLKQLQLFSLDAFVRGSIKFPRSLSHV